MKITKKITCEKAFIQACKELGLNPNNLPIVDLLPEEDQRSIIAYYKLTIIIRALNEGWEADFSDDRQCKYWNFLIIGYGDLVFGYTNDSFASEPAGIGSRLLFKDHETAQFALENFKSLYEDYLLIK